MLINIISKKPMPEGPTATELSKDAEQEVALFVQTVNTEKLLNLLRTFNLTEDNLVNNEYFPILLDLFIPISY